MSRKALDIPVIQLPVSNLEKAVEWYQSMLGLAFTFPFQEGDDEAWLNVNGSIGLGLIRCDDVPNLSFRNKNGELKAVLTFRVDDIHAFYTDLKDKGVPVGEMVYKEGGGYSFIVKDLDGHRSYIWEGWPKE
ncbi:VOC family protein [Halalkalibacterium halodurans]|jgi:catechol 2,3-dioxygenase-like lactoylglutathione lyase family enzyme|uniref:BH3221 protein n=2 Tax=Halalkalibacterium halodurans TaxID=86665 RepID=Q9K7Y6_HALH5|nr:VOC family protein [Halalkalibacterium halodurans]MDY7223754.1 VOC family protein [Halalkalibacterium halodurans]MDY7242975.1 VOC family protein [Halalkalibacterium halodurans]MED4081159.1 VOC family protein [Halalkalibacterium halodurans]MED4084402.1 VOC family protein [Halalkalibacterium halodurans]MED4103529.1 VOC family protein [Halalkalibacterium halodurans]